MAQTVAVALAAVAVSIYAVVVADGRLALAGGLELASVVAAVIGGAFAVRRASQGMTSPQILWPVVVAAAFSALAWELLSRHFLGNGLPLEMVTMRVPRNAVIALACFSCWRQFQSPCVGLSLFLALFGVTASASPATHWMAGLFVALAAVWLTFSYWDRVRVGLRGKASTAWPAWIALTPILLIASTALVLSAGHSSAIQSLRGFVSSSGGTGGQDPFARNGVGDGEGLVAGRDQIKSFGPIEDAPFMMDDQPSLYDCFDDRYDEPVRPPKTDRAVAITSKIDPAAQHLHSEVQKATRQFSTQREVDSRGARQKADGVASDAILYVAGRTPLHLRVEAFSDFDGTTWTSGAPLAASWPLTLSEVGGRPWIDLLAPNQPHEFLGPPETHAIQVIRLKTNVVPLPALAHSIHIDLIDRLDLFGWNDAGLLQMNREDLPRLTPIHIASRAVDTTSTDLNLIVRPASSGLPESVSGIAGLPSLAKAIVGNAAVGRQQVFAVVNWLKTNCTIDDEWRPAASGPKPVSQFLFQSKRGPDYLFATAAALLLRELGYSTRVASGFYARPENYDRASGQTAVRNDDLHFWTEARAVGGIWITLEPSPGYEVLQPRAGFPSSLWRKLQLGVMTLVRHPWLSAFVAALLAAACLYRIPLIDFTDTALWRFQMLFGVRCNALTTLRLLERRACRAGRPRPRHHSIGIWARALTGGLEGRSRTWLLEAGSRIDRFQFGPGRPSSGCRLEDCTGDIEVVRMLSRRWFRRNSPASGTERTFA